MFLNNCWFLQSQKLKRQTNGAADNRLLSSTISINSVRTLSRPFLLAGAALFQVHRSLIPSINHPSAIHRPSIGHPSAIVFDFLMLGRCEVTWSFFEALQVDMKAILAGFLFVPESFLRCDDYSGILPGLLLAPEASGNSAGFIYLFVFFFWQVPEASNDFFFLGSFRDS